MKIALALVAMSATATANVTPLSALRSRETVDATSPQLPDGAVTGGETAHHSFEYDIAMPFCGISGPPEDWVAGASDVDNGWRAHKVWTSHQAREFGIEQIVERDGHAALDRYLVNGNGGANAVAHGSIPLRAVGHVGGTTIYAFHHLGFVTVLIGGVTSADTLVDSAALQSGRPSRRNSECPIAVTQVRTGGSSSQLGEIDATLASGTCVRVDASTTKTSRDPEPILAVTARTVRCR